MTTHAIKISSAKEVSLSEAQTVVENWVSNHNEVLSEQRSDISVANTNIDGSGTDYFRGMFRFNSNDSKSTLLDEIETDLSAAVSWYQIEYHQCPHDEGGPCPDWGVERSGGTIPSDL